MPTTPVPYVNPTAVTFTLDGSLLTQSLGVFNPFPQDVLFKVDNAHPERYKVSLTQGVVCSRQKIYIEITCVSKNETSEDDIQVRFFRWSRPRQGQKPRAQQYIGYRAVKIRVFQSGFERERTPSISGSVSFSDMTEANPLSDYPHSGSIHTSYASSDTGHSSSSSRRRGKRRQVITNFALAVVLLVLGFVLNSLDEVWFSRNVIVGVKPQSLAIVCYTLSCVVTIKLLTFR
ncbi:unnamed protein product [Lymnaea stagnalis]|uniref:MSP domain-containing protein n=1 Tax=Lymnaea stagnalis TaxID=6523 RepID=A0AAV2HG61_LYMST